MDDGLEMIDRKNSVVSVKHSPLGITSNGHDDAAGFMGLSSKPKTSSTSSSSDSASTNDSFNESAAPPGYNYDDSITESSLHDASGPHRELAVDVPDSFVGTIKQTPRYPPLHQPMPSISSFKPQLPIRHDPDVAPNRMGSHDPFSLHDEGPGVGSDHCINTNSINHTAHKNMQPQPQTPTITKDKVFFVIFSLYQFLDSPYFLLYWWRSPIHCLFRHSLLTT